MRECYYLQASSKSPLRYSPDDSLYVFALPDNFSGAWSSQLLQNDGDARSATAGRHHDQQWENYQVAVAYNVIHEAAPRCIVFKRLVVFR